MASVSLNHIYKVYAGGVTAVSDFCLDIEDKEFIVLVGPSGCGKSTTLRMVAGLEEISDGELYIGDKLVNDVAPKDRDIAMVFQNYALYPHMTVYDNMAFGLKLRKTPKDEIKRRVEEAAKILDIAHLLNRKPKALSGGQRQRVALGRAIVREPKVFLFDEPLSNLDAKLRVATRAQIAKLQRELHTTMIYVTHDQVEAMTMGDRVAVLRDGRLQQVAAPRELYENPVNAFVAGFIGSPAMNLFDAPVAGGMVDLEGLRVTAPSGAQGTVTVGVRPEHLRLAGEGEEGMHAVVDLVEELGADSFLHCSSPDGYPLVYRAESADHPRKGEAIRLVAKEGQVRFFDSATGERLR